MERAVFDDRAIAADTDVQLGGPGNAGTAYTLLWAVRAALPNFADPGELGRWIAQFDDGATAEQVAQNMIDHYTGGAGVSTPDLVSVLFRSVAGVPIDPVSLAFFVGQIDAGTPPFTSQAAAFAYAATFEGAQARYEPIIMATGVEYIPFG